MEKQTTTSMVVGWVFVIVVVTMFVLASMIDSRPGACHKAGGTYDGEFCWKPVR